MNRSDQGKFLIVPHRFPDLDRGDAVAQYLGSNFKKAGDVGAFHERFAEAEILMITPYLGLAAADFPLMGKCRAVVRTGSATTTSTSRAIQGQEKVYCSGDVSEEVAVPCRDLRAPASVSR